MIRSPLLIDMASHHCVLGILGSPRLQGNTSILLNQALKGAESNGAEVKIVHLNELVITPCQHCEKCVISGNCHIDDDMQKIYSLLTWSSRLILASPVHFMNVTGQTKLMIDRCQVFWARKYCLKVAPFKDNIRRKGALISVGGQRLENLFQGVLATTKALFRCLEVELTDTLLVPGMDKEGIVADYPAILEQAFSLGEHLTESD